MSMLQNATDRARHPVMSSLAIAALLFPVASLAHDAPAPGPDIKFNSAPRMRYEVTIRIEDAPGPFDAVQGTVDYRVSNGDCVPMTPISGATITPSKRVPLELRAIGNNTYRGELFIDRLQDDDYFGKGVCRWSIVAASVEARVKKMNFAVSLPKDEILAQKSVTQYYSNRAYTQSDIELLNTGNLKRADFKDPAHTFSISVSATATRPDSPMARIGPPQRREPMADRDRAGAAW